jgi:hypothetical protein
MRFLSRLEVRNPLEKLVTNAFMFKNSDKIIIEPQLDRTEANTLADLIMYGMSGGQNNNNNNNNRKCLCEECEEER